MTENRSDKIFMLAIIAIALLVFVYFHQEQAKYIIPIAKHSFMPQKDHPHFQNVQEDLVSAGLFLRRSIQHDLFVEEKRSALAEIDLAENFVEQKTGQKIIVHPYWIPSDDPNLLKLTTEDLRSALNACRLAEEDVVNLQEKTVLHDHIEAALDKMLQIQQAEQKSQPEKSNP